MSCASCRRKQDKLLLCGQCKQVSYCGAVCQKKDWSTHKHACKLSRNRQSTENKVAPKGVEKENERFLGMLQAMRNQLGSDEKELGDNEEGHPGSLVDLEPEFKSPKPTHAVALPSPKMALHSYQTWFDTHLALQVGAGVNHLLRSLQYTRPSIVPGPCPPSLSALRPVVLKDLASSVNSIRPLAVIYLTTVLFSPIVIAGCSVFVQDSNGDQIPLVLYNYVSQGQDPQKLLPIGTRLALMQPFLKRADSDPNNGRLMLRCDNPEAVVIFHSDTEWNKARMGQIADPDMLNANLVVGTEDLKQRGEASIKAGSFDEALIFFKNALALAEGENSADRAFLFAAKAQCELKTRGWLTACTDATMALTLDAKNYKARVIHATALLSMGHHTQAIPIVEGLLKDVQQGAFKMDIELTRLQLELARAIREKRGEFDFAAMRRESNKNTVCLSRTHSNFVSPDLQPAGEKATDGRQRGFVAKQDLPENHLLLVTQALATADCKAVYEALRSKVDVKTLRPFDKAAETLLATSIMHELKRKPQWCVDLYDVDTTTKPLPASAHKVDVGRVWGLLNQYWFPDCAIEPDINEHLRLVEKLGGERHTLAGLWVTQGMLEHSCAPNCSIFQIGDIRVVRSKRPIAAGEPLTVSYIRTEQSYLTRTEELKKFGVNCSCCRCAPFKASPALATQESRVFQEDEQADAEVRTLEQHACMNLALSICEVREGAALQFKDDHKNALLHYQRAYKLRKGVMGNGFDTVLDGLRVVGALVICSKSDEALEILKEIFDGYFSGMGYSETDFVGLVEMHATRVWGDSPLGASESRTETVQRLARQVFKPFHPPAFNFRRDANDFLVFEGQ